jgi:nitrite reductase/ring-hydroxylating ferredoxin subunit
MTTDVGAVHDFPDGQVTIISIGRSEIGIIPWYGRIYAIGAICAHQGGPICRGILSGRLTGSGPGDVRVQDAAPVIACPWHGWEFDVGTGEAIWDSSLQIRTYSVDVAGGRVVVDAKTTPGN